MSDAARDSKSRFSDRVANYIKYRPGYPADIMDCLVTHCGLTTASVVADIGSGTGILTELFLRNGNRTIAIEPNREMREAAEKLLGNDSRFESRDGSAEQTGLDVGSVDMIVAGQAFHWFDRALAKSEFRRILRPGGWVVMIWNERQTDSTPFLASYESLLRKLRTDYPEINHMNISNEFLGGFFSPGGFQTMTYPNSQRFDFEGLRGRCLSSSYVPNEGQPGYDGLVAELREIFAQHQQEGFVGFEYRTAVHFGQLE